MYSTVQTSCWTRSANTDKPTTLLSRFVSTRQGNLSVYRGCVRLRRHQRCRLGDSTRARTRGSSLLREHQDSGLHLLAVIPRRGELPTTGVWRQGPTLRLRSWGQPTCAAMTRLPVLLLGPGGESSTLSDWSTYKFLPTWKKRYWFSGNAGKYCMLVQYPMSFYSWKVPSRRRHDWHINIRILDIFNLRFSHSALPCLFCPSINFRSYVAMLLLRGFPSPDHLLLDSTPNLGPLISCWEINSFENCWYKSVRIIEVLKLLFQQFLNLSSSQRDPIIKKKVVKKGDKKVVQY